MPVRRRLNSPSNSFARFSRVSAREIIARSSSFAPEISFGVLNNLLFKPKKPVKQFLGISAKLINVHMGRALVGRRQNVGLADQRVDRAMEPRELDSTLTHQRNFIASFVPAHASRITSTLVIAMAFRPAGIAMLGTTTGFSAHVNHLLRLFLTVEYSCIKYFAFVSAV